MGTEQFRAWIPGHLLVVAGSAVGVIAILAGGIFFYSSSQPASVVAENSTRTSLRQDGYGGLKDGATPSAASETTGIPQETIAPAPAVPSQPVKAAPERPAAPAPATPAPVAAPVAAPPAPPAAPAGPQSFEITCDSNTTLRVQDGDARQCRVSSVNGFSAPVSLACVNPPSGLVCGIDPGTVIPAAGGSDTFHLQLSNNEAPVGPNPFQVVGTSGSLTVAYTFKFISAP
ncbi:MAG TPA: hypothetical protein VEU28_00635 [Actinomycetota bacterium]|nr:hypothetical protein [Actinomycetota bacterium]